VANEFMLKLLMVFLLLFFRVTILMKTMMIKQEKQHQQNLNLTQPV